MTEIQTYDYSTPATVTFIPTAQDVAIQRLGDWAQSAGAAHKIATTLVQTSFVPDSFRNKPGEATAAILAGLEVGLQPMAALRSFDVIQGQAAPRAITLRAIVQSHGHETELVESTSARCIMRGRRRGSSTWQMVTWTTDRAQQLGVMNKPNWKNQPQAMLLARATSEICRLIAADAILGIAYTSEEISDGGVIETAPSEPVEAVEVKPATRRMSRKAPEEAPARERDTGGVVQPEAIGPVSGATPSGLDEFAADTTQHVEPAPMMTTRQRNTMFGALARHGIAKPEQMRTWCSEVLGRHVESRTSITEAEADLLLAQLRLMDGPVVAELPMEDVK